MLPHPPPHPPQQSKRRMMIIIESLHPHPQPSLNEPPLQQSKRRMMIKHDEHPPKPESLPPQPHPHCVADKSLIYKPPNKFLWFILFDIS